ncbi:MAG: Eco57I restriction-modification methylase domain-containing protein [Kiritimatiellae bacterium]|nr:Eco57I restriction-modification methylase domain-containing protein [Kiritimatiellia bacterium]MDD2347237.1 Eco57I restriction-modification methylase domain-containing protein [Kiritimatiellia bacterium]MDD3584491.1 Eco57I restriction-modification methylase domain-containing protein [Kiritimatiellia bacterium]HHU14111.1 SAM-dependent methyltransferase [Lentisphaerota bacterium]HON47492.1 Eco57I restriction-modification methylase domain-containing protein [Kiritimatiellia bacterium]
MVVNTDAIRLALSAQTKDGKKAQLGQFLTPSSVACFMASLFCAGSFSKCRLLDPGAGIGTLSAAFLDRCIAGKLRFHQIDVDTFEIDNSLQPHLYRTLGAYRSHINCSVKVWDADFIEAAASSLAGDLFAHSLPKYTHAILNPPYKKIRSDSVHRSALRRVGIETVNLYSAFVALSLELLEEDGQLVAIIPRSFCNGPYYRPFRELMLNRAALKHLHLFHARNKAFRDDNVLQENIIIQLERGRQQGPVTVSASTDNSFSDFASQEYPFDNIVFPDDAERFIRVPMVSNMVPAVQASTLVSSLADLGVSVSTGPVVDFRVRQHLRQVPEPGSVPLLYPGHFSGEGFEWPKDNFRKSNAIMLNAETEKWLYPKGFYTVVRRFSSKEEKRRIVASVVDPSAFPDAEWLGFENHLNVFHRERHGLPEDIAYGLTAFLNTRALDTYFRSFNGHTQVNATDLRQLRYPSFLLLSRLGRWVRKNPQADPDQVDEKVMAITA